MVHCIESEFADADARCCEAPPSAATCASASFTCQGTSVAKTNANCGATVCIASEWKKSIEVGY